MHKGHSIDFPYYLTSERDCYWSMGQCKLHLSQQQTHCVRTAMCNLYKMIGVVRHSSPERSQVCRFTGRSNHDILITNYGLKKWRRDTVCVMIDITICPWWADYIKNSKHSLSQMLCLNMQMRQMHISRTEIWTLNKAWFKMLV